MVKSGYDNPRRGCGVVNCLYIDSQKDRSIKMAVLGALGKMSDYSQHFTPQIYMCSRDLHFHLRLLRRKSLPLIFLQTSQLGYNLRYSWDTLML